MFDVWWWGRGATCCKKLYSYSTLNVFCSIRSATYLSTSDIFSSSTYIASSDMFCPSFCCITDIYYCALTALLMLLFIAGDIERNPDPPFNIVKSVKGSCHQGDIKFGDTAGMQCTCNSLFAICFSKMHRISLWRSEDLDLVL